MVGDKQSDMEAGKAAGCRTVGIGANIQVADRLVTDAGSAASAILDMLSHSEANASNRKAV